MVIGIVVTLTLLATFFRVSTAPERTRQRIESAKSSCLNAGGEWIEVDREQICQPARAEKI